MARRRSPGWPIRVRVIEVDDTGPIQTAIVERPEEPPPQLTLRHRMILAVVQRRYPKGIPPGVGIADLERLVAQNGRRSAAAKASTILRPSATPSSARSTALSISLATRITRA